jgi:hypothetical protein
LETLMHGSELEARSGDIPVDYNKYQDRPIRGPVAICWTTLGRGELIWITERITRKSIQTVPQQQSGCVRTENISQQYLQ